MVQRLWHNFKSNLDYIGKVGVDESARIHQLFVTANPILRNSVAKSFRALQSGYVGSSKAICAAAEPLEEDALHSLHAIADECWPLFLRAHNWLRLLDATLEKPYFTAAERSFAASKTAGWHSEAGVLDSLLEEDEESDDERDDDDEEEAGTVSNEHPRTGSRADTGTIQPRLEMTYDLFESLLWPHMLMHKPSAAEKLSRKQLRDQALTAEAKRAVEKSKYKASMVFRARTGSQPRP